MTIDQFFEGMTARLWALAGMSVLLCAVLGGRLWHVQIRSQAEHQRSIRRQSIRRIRVPPIRGRITSIDGAFLSDNRPVYNVYFHIHEMRQSGRRGYSRTITYVHEQVRRAAAVIERSIDITPEKIAAHIRLYAALPMLAFEDLNELELARLYEHMPAIPGLEITTDSRHVYPLGDAGAHLVGFVGRRHADSEDRQRFAYFLPEIEGRAGLEKAFEQGLAGNGGERLVRVDISGLIHEEFNDAARRLPQAGNDLTLTIDARAQKIAQGLLHGKRGAMVVLDCHSGAVLAMVSAPSYDLNQVSQIYGELREDAERLPLVNRAISPGYPPGSIIKPLVALSALEAGVVAPDEEIDCPGYYQIGDRRIRCAVTSGHGPMTLIQALEASCNTYFLTVGMRLGIDQLSPMLAKAGLGQSPGLEIPTRSGLRPRRELGRWIASDTAFVSIGQGRIMISPLQAALFCAAIANGGTMYEAFTVKLVRGPDGVLQQVTAPRARGVLGVSPAHLQLVRRGMYLVVNGDRATAKAARTPIIELAGKTGTAEIGGRRPRKDTWFICFGPYANPRYAMAVLVEDGVAGGKTAAPLARRFFEAFLAPEMTAN